MTTFNIDNFLAANPVFNQPGFLDECKRWEFLHVLGEECRLEPHSTELNLFVAYGMTYGAEGKLPDSMLKPLEDGYLVDVTKIYPRVFVEIEDDRILSVTSDIPVEVIELNHDKFLSQEEDGHDDFIATQQYLSQTCPFLPSAGSPIERNPEYLTGEGWSQDPAVADELFNQMLKEYSGGTYSPYRALRAVERVAHRLPQISVEVWSTTFTHVEYGPIASAIGTTQEISEREAIRELKEYISENLPDETFENMSGMNADAETADVLEALKERNSDFHVDTFSAPIHRS